jgi:hypothetical protein
MRLARVCLLGVTACTQTFGLDDPVLACAGDNFDDNALDMGRWGLYATDHPVRERNKRLEIEIPLSVVGFGGVAARDPLEASDSVQVELAQPSEGLYTLAAFGLVVDDENGAYMSKTEDSLRLAVLVANRVEEFMTPFQGTLHRFWRVHHEANQVIFSTSGDARSWTVNLTVDASWGDTRPTIVVYAGRTASALLGASPVAFDNFEIVTPSCSP